ncbi:hypothetical protein FX985_03256 [Pseudomonas extremaustralis]|uniref:ISL3 family transposase n=1 Tax=Pseudomonas extremaustralis TaxID=359110 RepID=A0A5M9J2C3_9PSED|nr:ISL3 family transposase [Pseudomonas extremaustralis]KAA8563188.1 hypothetical protein FX985_03256 [Pseudomonas extremaustralis]
MTNILDLPDWNVLSSRLDEGVYTIEAEYTKPLQACTKCGLIGKLYRHGPKVVAYRDSPIRGAHVQLEAKVQRYKCRECGGTSLQPLEGVEIDRRMTKRCVEYIRTQCLRDTFTRLAEHIGCDEKTIRNIANDYVHYMNTQFKPYLPNWLGIDETKIAGDMRCVLTDVGRNVPIDILPHRDQDTLARWLHGFSDRSTLLGVATDMWRPYLNVVNMMAPGVPVVIDKFHVVRMANYAVDKTRIRRGKAQGVKVNKEWKRSKVLLNKSGANLTDKQAFNLDMWVENDAEIGQSYQFKEDFYALYNLPKAEAVPAIEAWVAQVKASAVAADYKDLLSALKNWRQQIINYFDNPITNGYTEALNGMTKVINRNGRGYTFDIIRARVLFSRSARAGQSPEWFCVSCGGLFFEDETESCMHTEEGDDRKHCICPECSERSITQSMEWEDTIDWAEVYTHYSE